MSAQTGSLPPPAPANLGLVDRARFRFRAWEAQPNPLWIRELYQSARLSRTPVILLVVAVLMTTLIVSVGGAVSTEASPAITGVVIFQVFFSTAYFLVVLLGPAVAANSIASEREGHTWEAVLLTGLSPATIARGKFLASFTQIGMYVVMLAPVGALAFLFGGVTPTEVLIAFAGLFVLALLGVAFGLAVSSKMASLRSAILVTLLLAFPLGIVAFIACGFWLSLAAHRAWPAVPDGPPIWLPAAYERVPFGASYLFYLVILPLLAVVLPAWFLHEVTVANLSGGADDRSTGLKRWFLCAAPALTAIAAVPVVLAGPTFDPAVTSVAGLSGLFVFLVFCVFLFTGDPVGPSRRVLLQWDRRGAGAIRRFLGPGAMRSAVLLLAVGGACLGALAAVGFVVTSGASGRWSADAETVLVHAAYALSFYVFVVGLGAFLRVRPSAPFVARALLFAMLFGVSVVPWVVALVAGVMREHGVDRQALILAAPSPFYVFAMLGTLPLRDGDLQLGAGFAAMAGWAALGLALLGAAGRRSAAILGREAARWAENERVLAAEDEAAAGRLGAPSS
jgi:ABC-type transport system involved in multi-copper enzyme maturation permease subunit